MADVPTTNLTVAKLKALCVLNDLSASGKKADLLARLLEAGVDKETLGVEVFDEATATFHAAPVDDDEPATVDDASSSDDVVEESEQGVDESDEPIMLSLEDEETLTPTPVSTEKTEPSVKAKKRAKKSEPEQVEAESPAEDEVLEAEILEADLIDDDEEEDEQTVPALSLIHI